MNGQNDDIISHDPIITLANPTPSFNLVFHKNGVGEIGRLDFNGPAMVFTGNAEESARIFFDHIAELFRERLEQERAAARAGA